MARPAAGINHGHPRDSLWPGVEGARRGCSLIVEAQIIEATEQRAIRMSTCPPRTERVLQKEPHHVVLCEQLRNCGEVGTADFASRVVDFVLLFFLPELVHPPQGVVGGEHLAWEARD